MNKNLFENIYKAGQNSRLQEYSYDMNGRQIIEFFKKELFHPTAEYDSEMKAAMSSCIRILSQMHESTLDETYRILNSLYKQISKLSEGVYADNLGRDIDTILSKAIRSFDALTTQKVELAIKDSEIPDVENKLFAIADIYSRTVNLIKTDNRIIRNEKKDVADMLSNKLHKAIESTFNHMKQVITDLDIQGKSLYHSVGKHEKIDVKDLCLDWYLKNLKFADTNAISQAVVA